MPINVSRITPLHPNEPRYWWMSEEKDRITEWKRNIPPRSQWGDCSAYIASSIQTNNPHDMIERITRVAVEVQLQDGEYKTIVLDTDGCNLGSFSIKQNYGESTEAEVSVQIRKSEVREGSWI